MTPAWSALDCLPPPVAGPASPDAAALDRRSRSNWYMVSGVAITTTIGLALGLLSFVRGRIDSPWPWSRTEQALLLTLSAATAALVLWLTLQQRHIARLRADNERMRDENLERARRHNERLVALLNVSQAMSAETDVQAVLDSITAACLQLFDCDRVSLMLAEGGDRGADLVVRSAAGLKEPVPWLGRRQKVGQGVSGAVATTRQPLVLGANPFPGRPAGEHSDAARLSASMVVPIVVRGELVGVINVATERAGARYDGADLRALQVFAENAGASIRHAEQSNWMRQTIDTLRPPG